MSEVDVQKMQSADEDVDLATIPYATYHIYAREWFYSLLFQGNNFFFDSLSFAQLVIKLTRPIHFSPPFESSVLTTAHPKPPSSPLPHTSAHKKLISSFPISTQTYASPNMCSTDFREWNGCGHAIFHEFTQCRYARRGEECVKGTNYIERHGLCPPCIAKENEELKKIPDDEWNRYFDEESDEDYPGLAKKDEVTKAEEAESMQEAKKEERTKNDKGKGKEEIVEKGKTKEDAIVLD